MSRTRRSRSRRAPATAAGEAARGALALCAAVSCLAACAATHEVPDGAAGAAGDVDGSGAAGSAGAAGAGGAPPLVLEPIPDDGYTMETAGGYQRGSMIPAAQIQQTPTAASSTGCNKLRGIVRDFKGALPAYMGPLEPGGHPDFEVFQGDSPTPGLVAPELSADRKPVYTGKCELGVMPSPSTCPYGAMTTSEANFKQWYTSDDAVNKTYFVYFQLEGSMPSNSTFTSVHFFPVDGAGWGNSGIDGDDKKTPRNYSFTTEIHTTFKYNGSETFTFTGDDDVWIFINGKLAVDLGGLHMQATGMVSLDDMAASLGITKGMVYPLDLFHAERHSVKSDFGFQMNFAFQDCGYIIP
jgi:fibro-slime domain-containing protein